MAGHMIEALLPLPPTTNNLFFTLKNGRRAKTSQYVSWIRDADRRLLDAYRKAGSPEYAPKTPMRLEIILGLTTRRRDASNCLKPVEDALCRALPVPDDRYNDEVVLRRDPAADGMAIVRLSAIAAAA
jgi:Holliday junction resolvase RusA-like endonuclease